MRPLLYMVAVSSFVCAFETLRAVSFLRGGGEGRAWVHTVRHGLAL
jgi:hypothetical protein